MHINFDASSFLMSVDVYFGNEFEFNHKNIKYSKNGKIIREGIIKVNQIKQNEEKNSNKININNTVIINELQAAEYNDTTNETENEYKKSICIAYR